MWQDIRPTRSFVFTEYLQGELRERVEDATREAEERSQRVDEQNSTEWQADRRFYL